MRKDGSHFWGSIVITAIHDDKGQVIGFTKVTRDLTERKLASDKEAAYTQELEAVNHRLRALHGELEIKVMELHQANEDMQDFVHMVTHDLKGPLRIAQSLFSFLVQMEQSHFSQKSVDLQGRIQRALQRSQKLIDGLLQLSTIRDGMALVLKQADQLEVLATNRLDDPIDASPAIAGKQLFLRGEKYLYCIQAP